MRICGVIVLYNPSQENIDSIISYLHLLEYVYIIDNSDRPNAGAYHLQRENSRYISLNGNYGLGKALNVGCHQAIQDGFDYVITMDQDSVINEKNYEKYILSMNSAENMAVMSPQYEIDRKRSVKLQDKIKDIVWTMQSASIFDLRIMQKIGFFEEKLFIDTIDYEYCLRAKKSGFRVVQNMAYAIKHQPALTRKVKYLGLQYGYCNPIRIYYQSRNLRELKRKYKYWKINFIIIMKYMKILLFFDKKKDYLDMWKKGKEDFKIRVFGKLKSEDRN